MVYVVKVDGDSMGIVVNPPGAGTPTPTGQSLWDAHSVAGYRNPPFS
jgi:hypothetical protein